MQPEQGKSSLSEPRGDIAILRDRTDEIELIISSLTVVVLFTLPGWMFDRFADSYGHLSEGLLTSSGMAVVLLGGLSYALGSGFLLHLLTRAYWVGLIGLRSVFPAGIDWGRTPGIGPLTRKRFRQTLPDLQTAIERSDRLASSLFAVISVIALSIVWVLLLVAVAAFIGSVVGSRFDASDAGISIATFGLVAIAVGASSLLWFCDAVLAQRSDRLRENRVFGALVGGLARFNGWLFPQRLILPVQLTIQSNTRPFAVAAVFVAIVIVIVLAGELAFQRSSSFTVSDQFTYLDDADLAGTAFVSGHYEDMRDERDRLESRPSIPSFEQRGTHLRLFLPYQPRRDNPLLDERCRGEVPESGAACLGTLWTARLGDREIDLGGFLAAERMDLGLRGLIGAVPLDGLDAGMQVLEVTWNETADVADAGGETESRRYSIPFLFAPEYEAGVPSPAEAALPTEEAEAPTRDAAEPEPEAEPASTEDEVPDTGG